MASSPPTGVEMSNCSDKSPSYEEKMTSSADKDREDVAVAEVEVPPAPLWKRCLTKLTEHGSMETSGVPPTQIEQRTDKRSYQVFTLWFTMNCSILPILFGILGPELGCSLRDSALVILFFTLLTAALPAYTGTVGPLTGLRQMVQARYSFGRYIVAVPVLFNLATLTGFCVIIAVVGGQCLSAVSSSNLSPDVGIVVVSILSLFISFAGYRVLQVYEAYSWPAAIISIVIAVGCGGHNLRHQSEVVSTPRAIVSFGMVVASYTLPWACIASDFFTYLDPRQSKPRTMFLYAYTGLCIPTILLMTLGAAIGGAMVNVPAWEAGYESYGVGGVMASMLSSAGGFGKFVTVVLCFTLLGNIAATSYAITLNFQVLAPIFIKVPRYVFAILLTAIVIPVGIEAAISFYTNLNNFITLIAYWSSAFLAVVLEEYCYFRKGDPAQMPAEDWDNSARLPLGIAAITSAVCSISLIVPSMDQVWYVGPIAETTGDLGFEFAFIVTGLLYFPFRHLEKRLTGR